MKNDDARKARKAARTEIYGLTFGPSNTAADRSEPPERQGRQPNTYSPSGFKGAGKRIVELFDVAMFEPGREREIVRYFNRCRPKDTKPLFYERPEEAIDDITDDAVRDLAGFSTNEIARRAAIVEHGEAHC